MWGVKSKMWKVMIRKAKKSINYETFNQWKLRALFDWLLGIYLYHIKLSVLCLLKTWIHLINFCSVVILCGLILNSCISEKKTYQWKYYNEVLKKIFFLGTVWNFNQIQGSDRIRCSSPICLSIKCFFISNTRRMTWLLFFLGWGWGRSLLYWNFKFFQ